MQRLIQITLEVLELYFPEQEPRVKTKSPKSFKESFLSSFNTAALLTVRFIHANQVHVVRKDIQRAATIIPKLKKFGKSGS